MLWLSQATDLMAVDILRLSVGRCKFIVQHVVRSVLCLRHAASVQGWLAVHCAIAVAIIHRLFRALWLLQLHTADQLAEEAVLVADLGVIDDFGNEFLLIILVLIVEVKVSILHIEDVSQCLAVSIFLLPRFFIA